MIVDCSGVFETFGDRSQQVQNEQRPLALASIEQQSLVAIVAQQCGNLGVEVEGVPQNGRLWRGRLPIENVELASVHTRVPGSEVTVHDAAADFPSRQLAPRACERVVSQTPEDRILAVLGLAPSLCDLVNDCQSWLLGWLRIRQLVQKVLVD